MSFLMVRSRHLALALGLFALALLLAEALAHYAPYTWIQRDGRFYVNTNATLAESGSVDQSEFCASWYERDLGWNRDLDIGWSNVAQGAHGERLPKHPVLMPLASTPLFWAFGLHGTLIFNLLMLALAAGSAFLFARRYAGPGGALAAALCLVLATGVRAYAYDYHIDVMLLALLLTAIATLQSGRGLLAGLLTGMAVVVKPTTLLLLPSLTLLTLRQKKERRALLWAILGGTLVLLVFALTNWYFFGKPWWSAYNRVIVRVAGETRIADVSDAFATPWQEGLARLWGGAYGLRTKFPLFALALPGLLLLLRRRPLYVLAALLGAGGAVALFSHYRWEGDRFLWPGLSLLLPALAYSFSAAGGRLFRRRSGRPKVAHLAALAGALVVLAGGLDGPPIGAQVRAEAYADAPLPLRALAEGARELAAAGLGGLDGIEDPGRAGLFLLGVLLAALCAYGASRVMARAGGEALGAALAFGALLLPGVRERFVGGGPEPLAATFAILALAAAGGARRSDLGLLAFGAGLLSSLAAWCLQAPLLALPAALLLLYGRGRRASLLALGGALLAILARLGLGLGGLDEVGLSGPSLPSLGPYGEGAKALLLLLLTLGLLGGLRSAPLGRGRGRLGLALLWLGALGLLFKPAGQGAGRLPLLFLLAGGLSLGASAEALARLLLKHLGALSGRARWALVAAILLSLLAIGGAKRAAVASAPFRLATPQAVREAHVLLGEVPCDLLVWEHMSWECARMDRGTHNMVGLATDVPAVIGEQEHLLLWLPSGWGKVRDVRWEGIEATEALELRWAVPDGERGGGRLEVLLDGNAVHSLEVPPTPTGALERLRVETSGFAGRAVTLELRHHPAGGHRASTVVLDGGFVSPSE